MEIKLGDMSAMVLSQYRRICTDKCEKIKIFQSRRLHPWPKEKEPWSRFHMDHAPIIGM